MELAILESIVEVEINTVLSLPVALYTTLEAKRMGFSSCHQLSFQVNPKEDIFNALPGAVIIFDCYIIKLKN